MAGLLVSCAISSSAIPALSEEPFYEPERNGSSFSGIPTIDVPLVYSPGTHPEGWILRHEWYAHDRRGVIATGTAFTPRSNVAGETLKVRTYATLSDGTVKKIYDKAAGRVTCTPDVFSTSVQYSDQGKRATIVFTPSLPVDPEYSHMSAGFDKKKLIPEATNGRTVESELFNPYMRTRNLVAQGKNGEVWTFNYLWTKRVKGTYLISDYCNTEVTGPSIEFGVVFSKEWPTITGTPMVGETLQITGTPWVNGSTTSYQWQKNGLDIPGANSRTYQIKSIDQGALISALVIGSKAGWDSRTLKHVNVGPVMSRALANTPSAAPSVPANGGTPVNTPSAAPSVPANGGTPVNTPSAAPTTVARKPTVIKQSSAMKQLVAAPKQAKKSLVRKLTANEVRELDPQVFAQIPANTLNALSSTQVKSVTAQQAIALSSKTLKTISPKLVASLPPKTLSALPTSSLAQLTASQKKAVTRVQIKSLSPAQRKVLGR